MLRSLLGQRDGAEQDDEPDGVLRLPINGHRSARRHD
jgi:hypothetical protein